MESKFLKSLTWKDFFNLKVSYNIIVLSFFDRKIDITLIRFNCVFPQPALLGRKFLKKAGLISDAERINYL